MKVFLLIVVAGAIFAGGGTVFAQHSVTLEEVTPVWHYGDQTVLPVGQDVTFKLRVTHIDGTGDSYLPSFVFTVSSPDGATWDTTTISSTPSLTGLFSETFLFPDESGLPDYGFPNGSGADSVGVACISFFPPALYDGYDETSLLITIRPQADAAGKHIRLDALTEDAPDGWEWAWWGFNGGMISPDWGGPYDFLISPSPCGPPEFGEDVPAQVRGPYCESLSASFDAGWVSDPACTGEVVYSVADGPGTIDPVTGVWVWNDAFDLGLVGQTTPVTIKASSGENYSQRTLMATATYGAVEFTSGCNTAIQVEKGNVADMQFSAEAPCPEAPINFFISDDGGSGGYYYFVDGRLRWDTYFASTGSYTWVVGATTGPDTSFCTVSVNVIVSGCCGLYTNGYTGNTDCSPDGKVALGDVTRLVDRVYLSKALLCCEWNGNVDGDATGKMDLADITKLIDHIYLSKGATAPCQ